MRESHPQGEFNRTREDPLEDVDCCYQIGYTGYKSNQTTRIYSNKGKWNTLSTGNGNRVLYNGKYYKWSGIGFEVLQGLPENYTKSCGEGGVGKRQILMGNAWRVPVIKHIFSPLLKYNM